MKTIKIVPYDPFWPEMFLQEKRRIEDCLAGQSVTVIHHIGSTAIPAMPAKPVIDILISVPSFERARRNLPDHLNMIGYDFWHDNPKSDHLFFVKGLPPRGKDRTHHVHVYQHPEAIREHLAFRHHLRENRDDANQYALLKRKLAAQFADDREAYTEAKTGFVRDILAKNSSLKSMRTDLTTAGRSRPRAR
jgi:GrpB-like predicted nucleotidyltransferase (UPF0157 family)